MILSVQEVTLVTVPGEGVWGGGGGGGGERGSTTVMSNEKNFTNKNSLLKL